MRLTYEQEVYALIHAAHSAASKAAAITYDNSQSTAFTDYGRARFARDADHFAAATKHLNAAIAEVIAVLDRHNSEEE